MVWVEELQKSEKKMSHKLRNTLKKLSLEADFKADASCDALHFSAKSMVKSFPGSLKIQDGDLAIDSGSTQTVGLSGLN